MRQTSDQTLQALREAHGPALLTYCEQLTGSVDDAAGAVDEAFAAAAERLGARGRAPRDPRTELFRSARRACLERIASGGEATGHVQGGDGAEADVRTAVDRLPVRFRELLVLRELERMPLTQISAITDRPPDEVARLSWRARAALQAALSGGIAAAAVAPTPDCERAMSLAEGHADGSLPRTDERWLANHLDDCRRCDAGRAAITAVGARYRRAMGARTSARTAAAAAAGAAVAVPALASAAPAAAATRPGAAAPAERLAPLPPAAPARATPAAAGLAREGGRRDRRRLAGVALAAALALLLGAGLLASSDDDASVAARDAPAAPADADPPAVPGTTAREAGRSLEDGRPDAAARADDPGRDRAARDDDDRSASASSRRTKRASERDRRRTGRRGDRTRSRTGAAPDATAPADGPAPAQAPARTPAPAPAASPAPAPAPAPAASPAAPAASPQSQPAAAEPPPPPASEDCEPRSEKKGKGGGKPCKGDDKGG